jgi:hypothetical protein
MITDQHEELYVFYQTRRPAMEDAGTQTKWQEMVENNNSAYHFLQEFLPGGAQF